MANKKAAFAITQEMIDVDHLGDLKEKIKELQMEHDKLERKLRRKLGERVGLNYKFVSFDSSNRTFNYDKARRVMGAAAYERCWKENTFRSSRLTKIK